jgi:hypothetical protein
MVCAGGGDCNSKRGAAPIAIFAVNIKPGIRQLGILASSKHQHECMCAVRPGDRVLEQRERDCLQAVALVAAAMAMRDDE